MAKNPTVAQLIAKAIELNAALTEDAARQLIKEANARSFKKVAEAVEAAKVKAEKPKKAKAKVEVKIIEPGPRGFRFGVAYIQSVIDASGIALKEANKNKLIKFAETLGVGGITVKTDALEAVKLLKPNAKKFLSENFATA